MRDDTAIEDVRVNDGVHGLSQLLEKAKSLLRKYLNILLISRKT